MRHSRAVLGIFSIAAMGLVVMGARASAQGGGGGGMCSGSSSMPPMCMMNPGAMPHDSATMAQMQVIHEMVMNHDHIVRSVTYLPDGVRTTTESDDPKLAKMIQQHVATMDQRVEKGSDLQLPMESPALHAIFAGNTKVHTVTQLTPTGIIMEQTSKDSAVVEALQQHAAELSDLIKRGMPAMHEAMMKGMAMPKKDDQPARPPLE